MILSELYSRRKEREKDREGGRKDEGAYLARGRTRKSSQPVRALVDRKSRVESGKGKC